MKKRRPKHDLVGQRFGKLVVTGQANGQYMNREYLWSAVCDCGNATTVPTTPLRSGGTRSCGCIRGNALITHGATIGHKPPRAYHSWTGMLARCENKQCKDYRRYGGRGISVCDRWHSFTEFHSDMGERPQGTTLDRIDVNGNYEPGNCRWATPMEQARNRRTNRMITLRGQTKTAVEWAAELGIAEAAFRSRVAKGESGDVLARPIRSVMVDNRGSRHGMSKLTEESVAVIKRRIAHGDRRADVASDFGVSLTTIDMIARGQRWRHVA